MKSLGRLLIVLGFTAALAGCVVAPVGRGRAYIGVPAPVVVVHPYYYGYHRW